MKFYTEQNCCLVLHCNAQCRYNDDGGTSLLGLLFHSSNGFFSIVRHSRRLFACVCLLERVYVKTHTRAHSPNHIRIDAVTDTENEQTVVIRVLGCLFSFFLRWRRTSHMDTPHTNTQSSYARQMRMYRQTPYGRLKEHSVCATHHTIEQYNWCACANTFDIFNVNASCGSDRNPHSTGNIKWTNCKRHTLPHVDKAEQKKTILADTLMFRRRPDMIYMKCRTVNRSVSCE